MQKFVCDHIHLKSPNVEDTVKWYCDKFGGQITFKGKFQGSKVFYVDIAGMNFIIFGTLEGEHPELASIKTRFGLDHFGFEIKNIEEAVKELKRKGVNIIQEVTNVRPGLKIAYIEAPDRVRIELSERRGVLVENGRKN